MVQICKAFLSVWLLLFPVAACFAQGTYFTVPYSSNGKSNNLAGPITVSNFFQRTAILYHAAELITVPANAKLTAISFRVDSLPAQATGQLKIYLANTSNTQYSRGTTWSTILSSPTQMVKVMDAQITIPNTAGFCNFYFDQSFTYTGNGLYVAYEWRVTSGTSKSAFFATNSSLAGGVVTAGSPSGFPATLAAKNFRPLIRLGINTPLDVAELTAAARLQVYPNPARHTLHLQLPDAAAEAATVQLLNLQGQTIRSYPRQPLSDNHPISLAGLAPGTYLVRVETRNNIVSQLLVIE